MPYSDPSPASLPTLPSPSLGRPGHRRSYVSFSDERGPGAFTSLGSLPRRTHSHSTSSTATIPLRRGATFDLRAGDESSSENDSSPRASFHELHDPRHYDDDDEPHIIPPLKMKRNSSFKLSLKTTNQLAVPFPRTSPSPQTPSPPPGKVAFPVQSPSPTSTSLYTPSYVSPPPSQRPSPSRTSSHPIMLSTGKPLKSSLKGSSSSPNVAKLGDGGANQLRLLHLRARSAPSTPNPDLLSSSPPLSCVSTPKNVHFSTTDLETVRVFNRSAKPAALLGDETETETEGEKDTPLGGRYFSSASARSANAYPFPRMNVPSALPFSKVEYELDMKDYPVPTAHPSPHAYVFLESVSMSPTPQPSLSGTLLVKNVSFEKYVYLRFTLDDWQTTSEVSARYDSSLTTLPKEFLPKTMGDLLMIEEENQSWDRFRFTIRLEDYLGGLGGKIMWMVARYTVPRMGEWWDNNNHRNYRVQFKEAVRPLAPQATNEDGGRSSSASAALPPPPLLPVIPPSPLQKLPQPPRTSSSPTSSPTSPQREALVQATQNRLSKLSLKNYAAPAPVPAPALVSAKMSPPSHSFGLTLGSADMSKPPDHGTDERTPSAEASVHGLTQKSRFATGITLYWPWGGVKSTPTTAASTADSTEKTDSVASSSPKTDSPGTPTQTQVGSPAQPSQNTFPFPRLPTSSNPPSADAVPALQRSSSESSCEESELDDMSEVDVDEEALDVTPSQASSKAGSDSDSSSDSDDEDTDTGSFSVKLPSPPAIHSPSKHEPLAPSSLDSDSLYNAFVRQWCFAQGSPGAGVAAAAGLRPASPGMEAIEA